MKRMKAQNHGEQRVLHLMLKHEYFAKILEGKKSYEFLDLTNYCKSNSKGGSTMQSCSGAALFQTLQKCWSNTWDANGGAILTRSSSERLLS